MSIQVFGAALLFLNAITLVVGLLLLARYKPLSNCRAVL